MGGPLPRPAPELGTLVGVPTRHIVVAHPIRDRSALSVMAKMLQLVQRYFADGPGSLSDGLYWLVDGRMERLETWIDEQGPHLSPSPRFARVLEQLRASETSAGARTASAAARRTRTTSISRAASAAGSDDRCIRRVMRRTS